MPVRKALLAAFIIAVIVLYIAGDGKQYFDVSVYQQLFERSPWLTAAVFFAVFTAGTALSLPVAGLLTVAGGAVFGTVTGFALSLTAATLGGTLALYSTRFVLHDLVKRRFSVQLAVIDEGIRNGGAFYLFSLRMVTVIPFWLLNLLVGLTSMRVPVFMLATLTGMIPVILILSYTGSQLGDIGEFSLRAIFTPGLITALLLLALFPLLARSAVAAIRRRGRADED
ncbi:MAG: VTT domain-containing protein [Lysobacterales bacterium]|jgi:uncharacterized membrane protein YdjX (TVP38/TMEM64 family)